MKILLLYEYPLTGASMSIQGDLLWRGLLENGVDCRPCHYEGNRLEKEWFYKTFKPDAVIGIGWWVDTPTIITHPREFGLEPVPWLLADGWVANYHDVIGGLPLVFTTSRWVTEIYKRDGVDTANFEVLHVGFDAKLFKPISKTHEGVKEVRRMFGVRDDEKMILTVGGDVTSKGAQEMIRALAKVDKEYPNWKYVCKSTSSECARDHHNEEIRVMEEVGLDKNKVVYVEDEYYREFMPYLLNACDVYAAPSRIEGFGLVQLEAMACGTPVISIDAMGPKDTIVHGKTGFLAGVGETINLESELASSDMGFEEEKRIYFDKPKTLAYRADIDDLAKSTLTLLTNDELRTQMGKNAVTHARAHFQYRDLARKCIEILEKRIPSRT